MSPKTLYKKIKAPTLRLKPRSQSSNFRFWGYHAYGFEVLADGFRLEAGIVQDFAEVYGTLPCNFVAT